MEEITKQEFDSLESNKHIFVDENGTKYLKEAN